MTLLDSALAGRSLSVEPGVRVEFGAGALARLPDAVASLGRSRAFVVTDPGLRAAGVLDRVLAVLRSAGIRHEVFDGIRPNPSTADLDAAGKQVRAFCAAAAGAGAGAAAGAGEGVAVVAVGGGSALDSAKGIALLATNPGAAADFDYRCDPPGPGLPVIAVPTTAGTGAETNGFGVIEDVLARCKIYVGHGSVRPAVAVLDPELTLGLPRAATAATGFDALVHGIESLASRGATPLSAAYATQAVAMVSRWLPIAVEDGTDLEARAQLLLGAHLAGRALTLSGLGLVHGIAHSLTNHFHTVHGVALAGVLPEVMQFCADGPDDAARAAYRTVALAMGVADPIAASRELAEAIGVRVRLSALGLTAATVDRVARGAVEDVVTANSPRTPTQPEVEALLHSAL
jgi:alcohol dehydrogenase class IV